MKFPPLANEINRGHLRFLIKFAKTTSPDSGAGGHAALNLGVTFLSGGAHSSCGGGSFHARKGIRHSLALLQDFLNGIVIFTFLGQIRYGGNFFGKLFAVLGLLCKTGTSDEVKESKKRMTLL